MPVTYEPIATYTVSGTSTTDITFSSFSGYTDLRIVVAGKNNSAANADYLVQFNGDTGANYSRTYIFGSGSAASSGRDSSQSNGMNLIALDNSTVGTMILDIMNYSNSTTYKTALSRFNVLSAGVAAIVGLWRSTAAITTIKIYNTAGRVISADSTFTLYGIKAA